MHDIYILITFNGINIYTGEPKYKVWMNVNRLDLVGSYSIYVQSLSLIMASACSPPIMIVHVHRSQRKTGESNFLKCSGGLPTNRSMR
jgi:hypothetical protein